MTDYRGSAADVSRIRLLEKQREEEKKNFLNTLEKLKEEKPIFQSIDDRFAKKSINEEDQLKKETIGLVTLDSFRRKKQDLILEGPSLPKEEKVVKKRKDRISSNKLSFSGFDSDEEDNNETNFEPPKKIMKDPTVDTSFLPDKERDEREREERLRLKRQWLETQERIKNEEIKIAYSYYDGISQRKDMVVKKKTTIEQFLSMAKKEFKELRGVSTDSLMFIKEDLIIPHHYSFYELIETKARGKSGPLFVWDVQNDIRVKHDATLETEESHPAKIVERRWYESNKHIFPMDRWVVFDPKSNKFEKYTVK